MFFIPALFNAVHGRGSPHIWYLGALLGSGTWAEAAVATDIVDSDGHHQIQNLVKAVVWLPKREQKETLPQIFPWAIETVGANHHHTLKSP